MSIMTVGIDVAKNVFAVHGVDENGKAVLAKPKVAREQLLELITQLPPCVIGMEACSGVHHWARQFSRHGHTVRLMAPKFVTPYLGRSVGRSDERLDRHSRRGVTGSPRPGRRGRLSAASERTDSERTVP
jgi:transposase